MKKNIISAFVLFLLIAASARDSSAMSMPSRVSTSSPNVPPSAACAASEGADVNVTDLIKSAVQEICDGNFSDAEQTLSKADAKNPPSSAFAESEGALSDLISQYNQIELTKQQSLKKAFDEQVAAIEKFKSAPETNEPNLSEAFQVIVKWVQDSWLEAEGKPNLPENLPVIAGRVKGEPNLLEVFPVIVRAYEFAADEQKKRILSDEFVQKTIAKARQSAVVLESKGKWFDSLLYCYSWLAVLYEDDKTIEDKKKELEGKMLIEASLMNNPCEGYADRYQKIKPEVFLRSLDVLEYGYVEPFYYSNMADEAFNHFRYLAEVLQFSDNNTSPVTVSKEPLGENLPESAAGGKITITFSKDKIPDFIAGLDSLKKKYSSEPIGISKDQFIKLFGEVLILNSSTINLSEQIVVRHFGDAALSVLDPHTIIIWPKEKTDFEKNMTNEFTGIGVEISKADGLLRAVSLLPGTPAYYSGMDAGDIIEAVDGEKTRDMSITCAVTKITGTAGTKVTLTVRSQGEEKTRDIIITRTKIVVPTTRGWCRDESGEWLYFVDDKDNIGYVRVTNFSASTAADLDGVLNTLEARGIKALILDLRFNTGGYLQSAVEISDMFLDSGVIVSTQPRIGSQTWEVAHKKGTHPNYPVVILINGGSASASEIVAGALADKTYCRAILVGEQSYGKGSVQTVSDYPGSGAQLKFTMAYYHLPDGRKVKDRASAEKVGRKDWGIIPNVKVGLTSNEIKKLIDTQRDNDVLASANHDENKAKLTRHNLEETLQADPQLAVAVLVAKAKLIESRLGQ
ncbi:MAG: S41 family peptidase [Sedimentisphaerales bacterium]